MMTVAVKAGLLFGPGKKASFNPGAPRLLIDVHLPVQGRTTAFEYDVTKNIDNLLLVIALYTYVEERGTPSLRRSKVSDQ